MRRIYGGIIHIFICLYPGALAVCSVHNALVIVSGRNSVPSLAGLLEVTEALVADNELVVYPRQTTVVAARTAGCSVNISIGVGLMICTVEYQVVPQKSGRERTADVICVVRAV